MSEIEAFMLAWHDDSGAKELFAATNKLAAELGLSTAYISRNGISHSLRLGWAGISRPFFAMVDVIDDDPANRWISICMYADVSHDPEERGDLVPNGLNNQDAVCFDLDSPGQGDMEYMLEVLRQAAGKARGLKTDLPLQPIE